VPNLLVRARDSRALRGLLLVVALAVPLLTLPRLPAVSPWPVLLGAVPWLVGKYVLCPLRWHALSESGQSRWWHLRAYAEAELAGLVTPGHLGADAWRVKRLKGTGMAIPSGLAEVALDRLVGAVGLALFVAFAGSVLPIRVLLPAGTLAVGVLVAVVVLRTRFPHLVPQRRMPRPHALAHGVLLSCGYQLSLVALLYGAIAATGHELPPLALLGAFGVSQLAGAVPGPHGASPKDGALVVALAALGIPWQAALGAVALSAALAWLPALLLGGSSLLLARRSAGRLAVA
jgi:hypothetical protein